ncbi:MAG: Uma2 family endonuclease [Bacteroidia bacterium]|nr:Uma2 family endonuclease [Bacteroidia bacterium]
MAEVVEKISIDEYLDLETQTGERYEYMDGVVRAMAGTTLEHDEIVSNLLEHLRRCLKEKGCHIYSGNVKMHTPQCDKAFLYPDLHVYCTDLILKEKLPQGAYALKNPILIIEVLSKDTRNYDKGDKSDCYQKIEGMETYLMIESDLSKAREVFIRKYISAYKFEEERIDHPEALIDILGCQIRLDEIYKGLDEIKKLQNDSPAVLRAIQLPPTLPGPIADTPVGWK